MSPQDIRNLLGGYATGTLTDAEQQALYAAALEDEQLFAALADEQALKELLEDPTARGRLLASLDKRPSWIWKFALIGTAAVVAVVVGITTIRPTHERYAEIAHVSPPTAAPPTIQSAPPPPTPAPQRPKKAARKVSGVPLSMDAVTMEKAADLSKTATAASNADLTLRYGILKQGSTGAYAPAEMTGPFAEGDSLRVQVETSEDGTLIVSQGPSILYTASITGNVPTIIPQDSALTPKGGPLRVVFSRRVMPQANTLMRSKSAVADQPTEQISVEIKLR
jgi:hypothetical protein